MKIIPFICIKRFQSSCLENRFQVFAQLQEKDSVVTPIRYSYFQTDVKNLPVLEPIPSEAE